MGDLTYNITISKDKMQAVLSFEKNSEEIGADEIKDKLRLMGVKYGVLEDRIQEIVKDNHLFNDYIIAEGKEPSKPYIGNIEYLFKTGKDSTPAVDKDGNVDYKNLSLIANVKQGQLLAKLDPPVPGEVGTNIMGAEVNPPQVKPINIKAGKNTCFNENKTELYASKDGMVMLLDGAVVVNDVYQVPNNVGTSTGNINFEGSVIVSGNVLTGFEVIANGDIEVFGVVEGAILKAGGNIILHSGVTGMGRAIIEAKGSLMTKYIEQSSVKVQGDLHSGAILHSNVLCGGSVIVEGRKSLISGGKIIAGKSLEAVTFGSNMGTMTEIEVGVNPVISEQLEKLKTDLPKVKNELDQIEKIIALLNKRRELSGKLEEDKQEMYASAIKNKIVLTAHYQKMEADFKKLEDEIGSHKNGEIRANGIMHSGTKLTINNVNRFIEDDVKSVRFVRAGAELAMFSI